MTSRTPQKQSQFKANQTQSTKRPNERNFYFNKGLPKYTALQTPQKQTQFKANSKPIKPNFKLFAGGIIRFTRYKIRDTRYEIQDTRYKIPRPV